MIALKACALASEMLRAVGFERNYTSMKSEATYYQWPGCVELLRVAEHKYRGREAGKLPCIATITFSEKNYKADQAGVRHVPRDDIVRKVAIGIGLYFLRQKGVVTAAARFRENWPGFRSELNGLDTCEVKENVQV